MKEEMKEEKRMNLKLWCLQEGWRR